MACKVIVNADSGNYARLDVDKLLRKLGCVDTEVETIDSGKDLVGRRLRHTDSMRRRRHSA